MISKTAKKHLKEKASGLKDVQYRLLRRPSSLVVAAYVGPGAMQAWMSVGTIRTCKPGPLEWGRPGDRGRHFKRRRLAVGPCGGELS